MQQTRYARGSRLANRTPAKVSKPRIGLRREELKRHRSQHEFVTDVNFCSSILDRRGKIRKDCVWPDGGYQGSVQSDIGTICVPLSLSCNTEPS
jgi:hypothetical protein